MPDVSWDRQKQRFVINWRYPVDVQRVTGPWFRHRFPKNTSPTDAAKAKIDKLAEFNAIVEVARRRFDTPEGLLAAAQGSQRRLAGIREQAIAVIEAIRTNDEDQLIAADAERARDEAQLRLSNAGRIRAASRLGITLPDIQAIKLAERVAPYKVVIADFAERKGKDPEKDQGVQRKHQIMGEVAQFVGTEDMNKMQTRDLDRWFADLAKRRVSPPSIRDRYIHLNALFRWASKGKGRHIDSNPMADIEPQGTRSKSSNAMFDDDQRAVILRTAAAIDWQSEVDLLPRRGKKQTAIKARFRAVIRWANLLAGYMGRELGAIVDARTFDFSFLRDGTMVFDIRADEDRQLKTDEREGKFPVPLPVIRVGFPEYLEWVRATHGEGPVFPMLTAGKDGRRNTDASNKIAVWLRSLRDPETGEPLITDPRQRFHSWRHTITTMLTNAKVDGDRVRFITGHAGLDIHAKVYLKHPVHEVAAALALLADPLG
jgi:integrase